MNHVALAPHLRGCGSRFTDTPSIGIRRGTATVLLLCTLALSACGGGGSPSPDAPPDPASGTQWDQMKWDQGKWG